jgi:hypothetical protein
VKNKLSKSSLSNASGGTAKELNIGIGSLFIGGNLDVESYAKVTSHE